jgi:hypothetical protein
MQRIVGCAVLALVACGSDHPGAAAVKAPNNELILGEYERRPPAGTTAIRFRGDGSVTVAHDKGKLDGDTLATGSFTIDKNQLTLTYDKGMCEGQGPGVYTVVISKLGIHFAKVQDTCDQRAKIDGEVWHRIK